jgi:hypothetical protein
MKPDMFEKPVTILLGLGIPTEVHSIMHAYQILMDWPGCTDPTRDLALNACRAALAGDIEAQTARSVFIAFGKKHDLIAPEIGSLMTGRDGRNPDPHIS